LRINYWIGYEDPNDGLGAVFITDATVDTDDDGETAGANYEIKVPSSGLGLCATPPFNMRFLTNYGADMTSVVSTPAYAFGIVDPVQGGIIDYSDGQGWAVTIQAPPYAVTETTTIVYSAVPAAADLAGFGLAGNAFNLDAFRNNTPFDSLTFNSPVTVTIEYTDADVFAIDEDQLLLQTWNTTTSMWEDAACGEYDRHPTQNWLSVPICHLSEFGLFGRQYNIYLPLTLNEPH
jgi:hypothetical protein